MLPVSAARSLSARLPARAKAFSALGDETRLALMLKLCEQSPQSITELTEESGITRQAVTRHLSVLEDAGLVRHTREGRQTLFEFEPKQIDEMREYLALVSRHWDMALARLKAFVE